MLRLLWAAPDPPGSHPPARLTRSAPDLVMLPVPEPLLRPLHAFLAGTSSRLLGKLATGSRHPDRPIEQALDRDRHTAAEFFDHGPRSLRQLRLRHGRPSGPVSRTEIEGMMVAEVRAAIGEFRLPADPDLADAILGRKARPWTRPRPDRVAGGRTGTRRACESSRVCRQAEPLGASYRADALEVTRQR